jgi:quinone-modifying oxidoreductase subunit QmoC
VPAPLRPDLAFRQRLQADGAGDLGRCFQCATCAVTCDLSPADAPFPRKELLWAQWGLAERLLADPDVWLCHQCQDCSEHCPRGARPGDVLAAVRRAQVRHLARPRALARWLDDPWRALGLLAGATALFGLAALGSTWLPEAPATGARIAFATWNRLPQGLLLALFGLLALWALGVALAGLAGFWRTLPAVVAPACGWGAAIGRAALRILRHDDFARCTASRGRLLSHQLVLFGFAGLLCADAWVLAARVNPMLADLVYPLALWSPWKILANLAGLAALAGCALMARDRLARPGGAAPGTAADGVLLGALALTLLSGFAYEIAHFARFEQRGLLYLPHLAAAALLLLSFSQARLAHALYRSAALVWAERAGRLPPRGDHAG